MPNEDAVSHSDATKFMVAMGRTVYDSPTDLTLGMAKVIVITLLTNRRDDLTDANVHECINDIATIMHEYVDRGIALKRKLDLASKAQGN